MSATMSAMHNVSYPECDGDNMTQSMCIIDDGESTKMTKVANHPNSMESCLLHS